MSKQKEMLKCEKVGKQALSEVQSHPKKVRREVELSQVKLK